MTCHIPVIARSDCDEAIQRVQPERSCGRPMVPGNGKALTSRVNLFGTRRRTVAPTRQEICALSVARCGPPCKKRGVSGQPLRQELGEEPHAPGLACLVLGETPDRSVHVQTGAGCPDEQRVGISDEAGQYRHAKPLPHRRDLRFAIRGLERNPRGAEDSRLQHASMRAPSSSTSTREAETGPVSSPTS
jgi:hypothetical protein